LVDYFKQAAKLLYGLTKEEAVKCSSQYDNEDGVVMPQSWTKKVPVTCGSGD